MKLNFLYLYADGLRVAMKLPNYIKNAYGDSLHNSFLCHFPQCPHLLECEKESVKNNTGRGRFLEMFLGSYSGSAGGSMLQYIRLMRISLRKSKNFLYDLC
jgi:hypothetical protein